MEIWKDIKGFEGLYQVSNLGRVKRLGNNATRKERVLNGCKYRYLGVYLFKDNAKNIKYIHQLVAIAFLNHIPCGHKLVVNHKNLNKHDNRVENLEIITQRENANFKHIKSSSKYTGVGWNKLAKKWKATIGINGKNRHLGYFINEYDAHLAYEKALNNHLIDKI